MLSGQTWLLCPAASGRSVPPKRDGDRMGVCSSGFLLERPWQAQVEVHRRREVRLKVPVGASLAQMVSGHQSEGP